MNLCKRDIALIVGVTTVALGLAAWCYTKEETLCKATDRHQTVTTLAVVADNRGGIAMAPQVIFQREYKCADGTFQWRVE